MPPQDQVGSSLIKKVKGHGNCGICRLGYPIRTLVTRMAINGMSYADITRQLQDMAESRAIPSAPSYSSVVNHCHKHLPYKDEAVRRYLERRAAEEGIDFEEGVDSILRPISVAEIAMRKGHELIVTEQIQPTVKETLEAAKFVQDFERESADHTSAAEAMAQVNMIMRAVKDVVPQELWNAIVDRLEELRSGDIEDAELVEETPPELTS
jgi:hypothetical protein